MPNLELNDILNIIKKANLPKDEFWIGNGAALVLHGVLPNTKDIDAGCSKELFEELSKDHNVKRSPMNGKMISLTENFDLFLQEEKPSTIFISFNIEGDKYNIGIETLESMIETYKNRGRIKDLEKVQIIKSYLKDLYRKKG